MRSPHVTVTIDLDRVRDAAESIRRRTGVPLIAVIKADAYGLGAARVAQALSGVADEFGYFSIEEARQVGCPGLVLGPPLGDPQEYRALNVRPAVGNPTDAERFRGLPVALNVDVGMQRFGCPPEELPELLDRCRRLCQPVDALAHVVDPLAARRFADLCRGSVPRLHAAASALLDWPDAWLDAVRPGLALYRGAVRVSTPLHSVRSTSGPVGYTGFRCRHVGIILAGYSQGLSPASVTINGRRQRMLEVGMNSSFVSVDPADRPGDEVVLLGDGLSESDLAGELHVREHEVLCRYTAAGRRRYRAGMMRPGARRRVSLPSTHRA